jgi:hypothetical protein
MGWLAAAAVALQACRCFLSTERPTSRQLCANRRIHTYLPLLLLPPQSLTSTQASLRTLPFTTYTLTSALFAACRLIRLHYIQHQHLASVELAHPLLLPPPNPPRPAAGITGTAGPRRRPFQQVFSHATAAILRTIKVTSTLSPHHYGGDCSGAACALSYESRWSRSRRQQYV